MNALENICLERRTVPGLEMRTVDRMTHQELHLTLHPLPGETTAEMVSRLVSVLREKGAKVVRHEIFGPIVAQPETICALKREFGRLNWPVTWVEGMAHAGPRHSGMHIFAVAGSEVETVSLNGRPVGRIYSDGFVRHCVLGDVRPMNQALCKADQCRQTFERLECALRNAGMSMVNLARTWFYLDDILTWYESFNLIRNDVYLKKGIFRGLLPASTGIGGKNPSGAAILAGAWAVQKISGAVAVREARSPLQSSSLEYGSAFSRAVLVESPDCRRLLVSGTASINECGRSMHDADLEKQIGLTMRVIREMLMSNDFDFHDVTRATAYLKNTGNNRALDDWLEKRELSQFSTLTTQADICRDELLFEIELDAVALTPAVQPETVDGIIRRGANYRQGLVRNNCV